LSVLRQKADSQRGSDKSDDNRFFQQHHTSPMALRDKNSPCLRSNRRQTGGVTATQSSFCVF
jgi:hypothetical protein